MNSGEARAWIRDRFDVPRETLLVAYVALLEAEADRHNLISPATRTAIWSRHIADSAQLLLLAPRAGAWLDIGSGAGLPGLVIAMLSDRPVILVEPRRLRIDFLARCVEHLGLSARVEIVGTRVERLQRPPAAVISARAVAALPALLESAVHLADHATIWLLPKGRSARSEVAEAQRTWQGHFDVQPSLTDPDSGIVIAREVKRR